MLRTGSGHVLGKVDRYVLRREDSSMVKRMVMC